MARHLQGLNPAQLEAVRQTSGPLLVLAGAGTGKTRVVTTRIAELLSKGVPPSSVLAVTFTNKAALEMRERISKLLGGRDVKGMVLSTFHSLGLRILREFGERAGYGEKANIADDGDQMSLFTDALREAGVGRQEIKPRDARFKVSLWKNAGRTPAELFAAADDALEARLAEAWRRYDEELKRRRLFDFDDLITVPLRLLKEDEEVRATLNDRWRYLMVDEYQDTSTCQFEMVKLLAGARRNLCVVGDDDQSIYGWRGAAADRILRFTQDMPGARVVALEQNYRSRTRILDTANRLIAHNVTRREKTLWSELGEGRPVELYVAEDEKDEIDSLVARIATLRAQKRMRWEDCAILFRGNAQCRPLEQALRARDYPYKVVGTRSFFDRREVRDLLSFLRLARSDRDDSAFLRIVNVPARGIGKGSIDKLVRIAQERRVSLLEALRGSLDRLPNAGREGARRFLATLDEFASAPRFAPAFEALVDRIRYRDHLRQTIEEPLELQARLTIVDELVSSASEAEKNGKGSLGEFLDALALRDEDPKKRRKKDEVEGITLLTMHAAKGLEYPHVFIIGLEDGTLPHRRTLAEAEESGGDDLSGLEEERRLFYVGITRARERLHLSYARERTRFGRRAETTPSRFLDELGREHLLEKTAADDTPATAESGKAWLAEIRNRFRSGGANWEEWGEAAGG